MRQEFVIGGYTDPEGARSGFGALLLGVYDGRRSCATAARSAPASTMRLLTRCVGKLRQARDATRRRSSIRRRARKDAGAHWVKPELVGEVTFTEWTRDGTLRHPSFQGLREDKRARDVVRELPANDATSDASKDKPAATSGAHRLSARRKRGTCC